MEPTILLLSPFIYFLYFVSVLLQLVIFKLNTYVEFFYRTHNCALILPDRKATIIVLLTLKQSTVKTKRFLPKIG